MAMIPNGSGSARSPSQSKAIDDLQWAISDLCEHKADLRVEVSCRHKEIKENTEIMKKEKEYEDIQSECQNMTFEQYEEQLQYRRDIYLGKLPQEKLYFQKDIRNLAAKKVAADNELARRTQTPR